MKNKIIITETQLKRIGSLISEQEGDTNFLMDDVEGSVTDIWDTTHELEFELKLFGRDQEDSEMLKIIKLGVSYEVSKSEDSDHDYPGYLGGIESWQITAGYQTEPVEKDLDPQDIASIRNNARIFDVMDKKIIEAVNEKDPYYGEQDYDEDIETPPNPIDESIERIKQIMLY